MRTVVHRVARWNWQYVLAAWLSIFAFTPAVHAAENLRVLTVLSDSSPLYQTFAQALAQDLSENIQLTVLQRAEDFTAESPAADLVVTVGAKAADWVAGRSNLPMLAAMIPSHKYAELVARRQRGSQTSAVYVDQPWGRQIALLRAALPERTRVGLLYSAEANLDLSELHRESQRHRLNLVEMPTRSEEALFGDLVSLISRSDVLLALPDSRIFNSNTIRNILLESYRHNIPLVGLSQSYVNAGALCAVFSTPEQLVAQTDAMVNRFAQSRRLPQAQFPALYKVAINQEVMRALGISIKSTEWLHLQIDKMQGVLP